MKSFATKWWPKGMLNAKGEIEWDFLSPKSFEGFRATLTGEISGLMLRNCPFKVIDDFQMIIKPHEIFSLKEFKIGFHDHSNFNCHTFDYRLDSESIQLLKSTFEIPHHQLEIVGETFHHHFPELLDLSVKEILACSKEDEQLKGAISIESSSNHQHLRLTLEDGQYIFKKRKYSLKNFQFQLSDEEMKFSAFSQEERLPFRIMGQSKWPSCQEGECRLTSLDGSKSLFVNWTNQPEGKFSARSIQGEFGGCLFDLKGDGCSLQNNEWAPLKGRVVVDFNRISSLCSLDLSETIQKMKVGSLYTFDGDFWVNSKCGVSFLETISFQGKVTSQEPIFKGYQMKKMEADLQYVPGRLDVQNFIVEDPAGSIKIPHCIAFLENSSSDSLVNPPMDRWNFVVPQLNIRNFRPFLLRGTEWYGQPNSKLRTLLLKRVDFQNVTGELGEIKSWEGEGSLTFLNSSRKNPLHTLFAIPAEIILRLGLDPHVLNPVSGTILFDLQGDHFYLKRFKDVYSEGRGSKFYLVGPDPSWVDMDGNLSVNIRMKQYNLMFKIAELFTVSIQGNIKKPRYTLQKQPKLPRKGGSNFR